MTRVYFTTKDNKFGLLYAKYLPKTEHHRSTSMPITSALAWLQLWSLGPKKLQGVDIWLTDKLYANYFFIGIEFNWLEHTKVANFWFSKSFFFVKNQPNSSQFFFHWRISNKKKKSCCFCRSLNFIHEIFEKMKYWKNVGK